MSCGALSSRGVLRSRGALSFRGALMMSGECVVGVQRLNFVGDDFHLFLSGLIRSYVFVILLSLSSLVVLGNLMVRMC